MKGTLPVENKCCACAKEESIIQIMLIFMWQKKKNAENYDAKDKATTKFQNYF